MTGRLIVDKIESPGGLALTVNGSDVVTIKNRESARDANIVIKGETFIDGTYSYSMPGISVQHSSSPFKFGLISGYNDNQAGPNGGPFYEVNIGEVEGTSNSSDMRNPQVVNINTSRPDGIGFRRRMNFKSNGGLDLNIEGYPGVADSVASSYQMYPAYVARAWVFFDGTGTVAIRGSGNVSSITDYSTGNYAVNFATALPDINHNCIASCHSYGNGPAVANGYVDNTINAGVATYNTSFVLTDINQIHVAVFR